MSERHALRHTPDHGPDGRGRDEGSASQGPDLDEIREVLRHREAQIRDFLLAHPLPVLLGALAGGYLLARLVRGGER